MKEKEKWINKKELIGPLVSIVAFLLLMGGASYAYFTAGTSTAQGGTNTANYILPARCVASVSKSDCTISVTQAMMTQAQNSTTNKYYAACSINVTVNGNQGCKCNYSVQLRTTTASNYSSAYVNNSIKYQINTTANVNVLTTFSNTTVVPAHDLAVSTTGTAKTERTNLNVWFFNLNASQDAMTGKKYDLLLYATPVCTMPTA